MKYETSSIPFVKIGNRRALTGLQMMQDATCREFYERFKSCFEPPLFNQDAVLFIEPDMEE